MKRIAAFTVAAALLLTACGSDNFRDVKGVKSQDPDSIEVYNNVDKHPNIARVCIDSVAFATTTRNFSAIMRVPEWDNECKLRSAGP